VNQLVMDRTVSRTARPRTAPAPSTRRRSATAPTASAPHEVRSMVGIATGVLVILLLAAWSFAQGWGRGPVAGPGQIALDGGIVRVDGVVSAARPQHAMPGMGTDNDPVAEDERRISVDVTLRADEDATLEYTADRFRLVVPGGTAQAPHKLVLPEEELPPGTTLAGTLIFDVPKDATSATLSYGESRTTVELPAEAAGKAPAPAPSAAPHGDDHA
jgi:Domain of unknown function (DUF4352)